MKVNFDDIKVIPAHKENNQHCRGVWEIFNENLEISIITKEPVPIEDHYEWWKTIFTNEYIYIVLYDEEICGYIRLTKNQTNSKEKNEISIALAKKFHKTGIGSYAYRLFEKEMKKLKIPYIIAKTKSNNSEGMKFFERNDFQKDHIRYLKEL